MIGQQLPAPNEPSRFIKATFTPPEFRGKANSRNARSQFVLRSKARFAATLLSSANSRVQAFVSVPASHPLRRLRPFGCPGLEDSPGQVPLTPPSPCHAHCFHRPFPPSRWRCARQSLRHPSRHTPHSAPLFSLAGSQPTPPSAPATLWPRLLHPRGRRKILINTRSLPP